MFYNKHMSSKSFTHFCPVCRAPVKNHLHDSLTLKTHIQIVLITLFVSGLVHLIFGFEAALKSTVVYFIFWAIAEFLHWAQMRDRTKCRACGFDPILYRKDWRKARDQVESRLRGVVDQILNEQLKSKKVAQKTPGQNDAAAPKPANNPSSETRP
jgi:hypothetical protein